MSVDEHAKTLVSELRQRLKGRFNHFPNTSTLADFHPHSQTIHIHNIGREDFQERLGQGPTEARPFIQVMMHETTHWADLLGTLWGRKHLVEIYNALNVAVRPEQGLEEHYWKFVSLHDAERRIAYPQYYKTIARGAVGDPKRPWRIEYTSGIEFGPDGRADPKWPIFFVRFSDRMDGTLVARQPLSVSALLETNAMWSEMATGFELLSGVDHDVAKIEEAFWRSSVLNEVYSPELTEYSGPAHMLSVLTGTQDIALTYEVAASLGFLVLNMPHGLFKRLHPPQVFEAFGDRNAAFVERLDRGYLFAVLCNVMGTFPREHPHDFGPWIDSALEKVGLPPRIEILRAAQNDLAEAVKQLDDGPLSESARYLLDIGMNVFAMRCAELDGGMTMSRVYSANLVMPLMFDASGLPFALSKNIVQVDKYNPFHLYNAEWALARRSDNFLKACR